MNARAIRWRGGACGLVLLMALLAGCITPAVREPALDEATSDPAVPGETATTPVEETREFDPWLLPETPIRYGSAGMPGLETAAEPPAVPVGVVPVIQVQDEGAAPAAKPASGPAQVGTRDWRVQLYSGRSPATADALVAEARLLFPEHTVDRVGEQADLKVLVGHFDSADSAAGLKQRAVRLGFAQAWVVETIPDPAD